MPQTDLIYGLFQYSTHSKSSKKKKKMSLADYLAECPHTYWVGIYMQKEIFFHESHDLSCLLLVGKKQQRLQGLLHCVKFNSMQLFMESLQGTIQHSYMLK